MPISGANHRAKRQPLAQSPSSPHLANSSSAVAPSSPSSQGPAPKLTIPTSAAAPRASGSMLLKLGSSSSTACGARAAIRPIRAAVASP